MFKFKYHYLTNTLAYQTDPDLWYQLTEEKQFIRFNSQGFVLEPPNHWINFTVYESKIKVFYKEPTKDIWSEKITYYRKYLPKQEEIIFTFNSQDEVEKAENKWRRKDD